MHTEKRMVDGKAVFDWKAETKIVSDSTKWANGGGLAELVFRTAYSAVNVASLGSMYALGLSHQDGVDEPGGVALVAGGSVDGDDSACAADPTGSVMNPLSGRTGSIRRKYIQL